MSEIVVEKKSVLQDRAQGGKVLAERLGFLRYSHAVVIPVSNGGVAVGASLAQRLHLTIEPMFCVPITHPADSRRVIGSVCGDDVVIHADVRDLPQSVICHQIQEARINQHTREASTRLEGKTIIFTDDWISDADELLAAIQRVKVLNPLWIVIAVPAIEAQAMRDLAMVVDDLQFIFLARPHDQPAAFFDDFPPVLDQDVNELLKSCSVRYGDE